MQNFGFNLHHRKKNSLHILKTQNGLSQTASHDMVTLWTKCKNSCLNWCLRRNKIRLKLKRIWHFKPVRVCLRRRSKWFPGFLPMRMARCWAQRNRENYVVEGTPDLHKMPLGTGLHPSFYWAIKAAQTSAPGDWTVRHGRAGISCSARGKCEIWSLNSANWEFRL